MPEQQTVRPAETSLGKPLKTYFHENVYSEAEFIAKLARHDRATTAEIYSYSAPARGLGNYYLECGMALATRTLTYHLADAPSFNRALAERLCLEHPDISTYPGIFGGMPHIDGVRFSVANVLSELYLQGSVSAVAETFSLDENQIKEAIAYAQDFLESALSPRSEVDG